MVKLDIKMPKYCVDRYGRKSNCPLDRIWCVQEFCKKDITMKEVTKEQTENIPYWCPLKESEDEE